MSHCSLPCLLLMLGASASDFAASGQAWTRLTSNERRRHSDATTRSSGARSHRAVSGWSALTRGHASMAASRMSEIRYNAQLHGRASKPYALATPQVMQQLNGTSGADALTPIQLKALMRRADLDADNEARDPNACCADGTLRAVSESSRRAPLEHHKEHVSSSQVDFYELLQLLSRHKHSAAERRRANEAGGSTASVQTATPAPPCASTVTQRTVASDASVPARNSVRPPGKPIATSAATEMLAKSPATEKPARGGSLDGAQLR